MLQKGGTAIMSAADTSFERLEIGRELIGARLTVTESHVMLACGLFNDFAPLHADDVFARASRYGGRIAHGPLLVGIMSGVLGSTIGPYALGLLEQNTRFRAPVRVGETVEVRWIVRTKQEKPKLGGGIVQLDGTCSTSDGTVAVSASAVMIVGYGEPPADGPEQ
jgi:acyl dehydratase